ncbi:hypothetical protein SUGI_1077410 [Cryptomeria japonica]|nr:hypothetical protein SUGI_1077410 [Cryptomeria japonica]
MLIKDYLRREGLESNEEEETIVGSKIKEEMVEGGDEDDPFHSIDRFWSEHLSQGFALPTREIAEVV